MKETKFRHILLPLFALSVWTGCDWSLVPDGPQALDHCIEITLANLQPALSVKGTSEGVAGYNENLVETVDCFFYPDGGTDSDAVFTALGRGVEATADGYKVKVFFTDADAMRMFGNANAGTCQLYVICNAPLNYGEHTDVASLRELVVENDFTGQTVQPSFVMSSDGTATVTLTTTGSGAATTRTASASVDVSRAAAKIQFFLNIPSRFVDLEGYSWEPVLDAGISISMTNAVKRGKVDGTYAVQPADYVTYGSRPMGQTDQPVPGYEDFTYTHVPFYSYPCSWSDLSDNACSVVFRIAWKRQDADSYQWKKYQLSPNISSLDLRRNQYYRTFVSVHSLGGADKESIAIIPECDYTVLPWMSGPADVGGQGIVPGNFVVYKYLVVDEPEVTLNNEQTAGFAYVSSSPVKKLTFRKAVYLDNRQSTPRREYTFTGNSGEMTAQTGSVSIPNVANSTISYSMETPGLVTISHSLVNVYTTWEIYATLTNEDGCTQDLVIVQNPSIRLECFYDKVGDVFVDGFFARVYDSPFGGTRNINGVTYRYGPGTNVSNNQHREVGTLNVGGTNYNYNQYGSLSYGLESNYQHPYTTEINLSSFNTEHNTYAYTLDGTAYTKEYRIGDPRIPAKDKYADFSLYPYLTYYNGNNNNGNTYGYWQEPGNILIANQDLNEQNLIAPRFLISSTRNSQSTKPSTFEDAVKRAATYQEAGYPAGRWRLPTEAEIAFIIARQQEESIPELFTTGGNGYWTASGKKLVLSSNRTIVMTTEAMTSRISSRLVYDLWYWGDEPSTANVYHPNGHIFDYDSTGAATPR